jgi:hypothetical protein
MTIQNLPGIFENVLDGSLTIVPVNDAPIVLVLGTASKGTSESLIRVDRPSDSTRSFGKDGTLIRGMYEASIAGAQNLRLFRIGATPAKLTLLSGTVITTVSKDGSAGTDYILTWGATAKRLMVWRAADEVLVYDNNPALPLDAVNLSEITVDGDLTTEAQINIGSGSLILPAEAVTFVVADATEGTTFVAGNDGLELSRMEMYEALHNAYELLDSADLDVIVPMDVYLDDKNVMDMTQATVSGTLSLITLTDYPAAGTATDVLGKLYVEEVDGENRFWWWFPAQPNDPNAVFTAAQIYPVGVTGCTASQTPTRGAGDPLTDEDFHEVNFAYQLANFCYTSSRDNTEMTGSIGTKGPDSFALKNVSIWIGDSPTSTEDANGNLVISVGLNGTGLLGNKFMCGRKSDAVTSGTPGLTIDALDGLLNGGFICTDTGWLDDAQVYDNNDHLIDIGKYISVVAVQPILSNPARTQAYVASGAATYAGFYSVLPPDSAPTNKLLRNLRLPFRISISKLDLLAGQRYVTFHAKSRGIVVSDAPSAARPDSDYQRLSTMRQVKDCIDAIRKVAEPFLGEGMTGARLAALDTAIEGVLKAKVRQGVIARFDAQVTATPTQKILGQATLELVLVPAFELRQLTVVVSLAAS